MAEPLTEEERGRGGHAVAAPLLLDPAVPARTLVTERWVANVLRAGALGAGGLFLGASVVSHLPSTPVSHELLVLLRKAGVLTLLATPVMRLLASGVLLGARGEWRYTLYALGVLGLLGLSVGARV